MGLDPRDWKREQWIIVIGLFMLAFVGKSFMAIVGTGSTSAGTRAYEGACALDDGYNICYEALYYGQYDEQAAGGTYRDFLYIFSVDGVSYQCRETAIDSAEGWQHPGCLVETLQWKATTSGGSWSRYGYKYFSVDIAPAAMINPEPNPVTIGPDDPITQEPILPYYPGYEPSTWQKIISCIKKLNVFEWFG